MKRIHGLTFLIAACAYGVGAAQTPPPAPDGAAMASPWNVSGYGTVGYSHLDAEGLQFTRDLAQRDGRQGQSGWTTESRVGVQAAYRFSPQTRATVQVVLRDQVRMGTDNLVEWAYLSHQPSPAWQVRVGRMGVDFFLLSDLRSLDYSQIDIRPPTTFYGFIPLNSLDGADATWTLPQDDGIWRLKAQAGAIRADVRDYTFRAHRYFAVSATREWGPWRVRIGTATLTISNNASYLMPLSNGLGAIAAMGIPGVSDEAGVLARDVRFADARATYSSIGASYDDGVWVAQGELSRSRLDRRTSALGTAAYLTVGRRFGTLTPYAGVSRWVPTHGVTTPVQNWAPIVGPAGAALQAGAYYAINSTRIDQRDVAVGLRWDATDQVALKVQWDRIRIGRYGYGNWYVPPTHAPDGETVSLTTASLNWVF